MVILSKGIVAGQMDWILIFVGMLRGVGFIMMNIPLKNGEKPNDPAPLNVSM
jgi:uncharacterized oligopeptide transporter (OPT) family protein